jgi:hypothetical protein
MTTAPNRPAANTPETAKTTDVNITEGGRAATHRDQLPTDRPSFHCGYCGEPVGPEGQHWNEEGDAKEGAHAGTMVVADNWPEQQDEQDAGKRAKEQARRDEINGR